MGADYHYSRDGQSFGPVSVEQLRELAANGQICATDLVWKEGMAEWVPAGRFKGLIPAAPVAPQVVQPSAEAEHEFRMAEPAPAPVMPSAALPTKPRPELEKRGDEESQAEVLARQAKEAALAAGGDALKAFKALAKNPVGGLKTAFESLGPTRAMAVGIVFAVLFDLCVAFVWPHIIASYMTAMMSAQSGHPVSVSSGFSFIVAIKLIILGCVPFASAVGGFAAVRAIFKGQGSIHSDMFVAGASLLPAVIAILATQILGAANFEVIGVFYVFSITTTVLVLYSGCTTLQGIPDAAATLAVPLMIVADIYICKIIAGTIM